MGHQIQLGLSSRPSTREVSRTEIVGETASGGLLGFGGMRSFEKHRGVAAK